MKKILLLLSFMVIWGAGCDEPLSSEDLHKHCYYKCDLDHCVEDKESCKEHCREVIKNKGTLCIDQIISECGDKREDAFRCLSDCLRSETVCNEERVCYHETCQSKIERYSECEDQLDQCP